tara:strand:+ start:525 stop:974 length:450 start_codon:yes stop_codon:yes gene_type:complete
MSQHEKNGLKLIGKNREDLRVISAYSQDSIVAVKDMTFLKKNRIFIMIINRFMWEDIEKGINRKNKRIKSALKFEGVLEVKSKKINQNKKTKLLECLAIECNENMENNNEIKIFFAGGGIISLKLEYIEVVMHDIGNPWYVKHMPRHNI